MALPTATTDTTKVVTSRQSIVSVVIATVTTNLLVDYVSHNPGLEVGSYMLPGTSNGPAFVAGNWEKSRGEIWKFRTKEIKKINTLLGSLSGFKEGTAILYIRDAKDSSTVALLSESFAMSIFRDPAEVEFSGANPSEITLVIASHKDGAVQFTNDGTP